MTDVIHLVLCGCKAMTPGTKGKKMKFTTYKTNRNRNKPQKTLNRWEKRAQMNAKK